LLFLETSAKTAVNVETAFSKISELILNKIERGEMDPSNEVNSILSLVRMIGQWN
jgi:GTPase SAR1 family protein